MPIPRKISLLLAGPVAAGLLACVATAVEPAQWDQARVTALAEQLFKQLGAVYDEVYREGAFEGQIGTGDAYNYTMLKDRLRVARFESEHLAAELEKGKGYHDTVHSFERLMELVRDARVSGRRIFITKQLSEKLLAARQTLSQLAPYYDPDAMKKGPPPIGTP